MADNYETRISLAIDTANSAQSIGELKASIRELEGIAVSAGDKNKEAFLQASMEAGKLRDRIEDTKDAISTFKGDPIENISKGFGTLKDKITNLDFKGFSEEVGRLKTVSKDITFKELSSSVVDTGKSFANLGKILLTNPLFLIVSVVGLIITKFDELKSSGGIIGEVFSSIGNIIGFVIDKLKMLSDWLGLTDFEGQEKAENTLKNAEKEQSAIEKRYDAEIAVANAAGKNTKQIELEKEEAIRKTVQLQIDQLNYLAQSQGKLTEDQLKNLESLNEAYNDSLNQTSVINAQAQKEADDKAEAAAEERAKKSKERNDKIKANQADITSYLKSEEEKRLQDSLSAEDKELRQAELKYQELITKAGGNKDLLLKIEEDYRLKKEGITTNYDNIEKEKLRTQEFELNQIRIKAENDEFAARQEAFLTDEEKEVEAINQKYDRLFETITLNGEEEKLLMEQQQGEINKINKKYYEEDSANKQKAIDDKKNIDLKEKQEQLDKTNALLDASSQVFGALSDLNGIFEGKSEAQRKKSFERNKKLQIAQALISTYQAANNIFASAALNPSTVLFPAQPFIAAGAAIVAGLAQVNKIRKTQYESSSPDNSTTPAPNLTGGGGGSEGNTPTFSAPQFFGLGQGSVNNQQSGGTQQVVVLENDITRTQNRVRVIENRAVIG